jgi:hypothetical protein
MFRYVLCALLATFMITAPGCAPKEPTRIEPELLKKRFPNKSFQDDGNVKPEKSDPPKT